MTGGVVYEKERERLGAPSSSFGVFTFEKISVWSSGKGSEEWNEKLKPLWLSHSHFGPVKVSVLDPVPISFAEEERAMLEEFYIMVFFSFLFFFTENIY